MKTVKPDTSVQLMVHDYNAYAVAYAVDNWGDPLGSVEVLEIHLLFDEFGTGEVEWVTVGADEFDQLERHFRDLLKRTMRVAMGAGEF
jgi:hypothetical protein